MPRNRWPHIGEEELKALWERHAPPFLRLESPDQSLPELREVFLSWLESTGVDLGAQPTPTRGRRLRLDGVRFVKRGFEAETAVTLSLNGNEAEVSRTGRAQQGEILRLSAESTLDALHQLVPNVGFGLDRAFTIEPTLSPMSSLDAVAIVVVHDTRSRPIQQFIGAAGLSVSEPEAAAKATLDAINRQVEKETALPELVT